ncbi:endonuclease/exonuclease/phosphatase family protein, partial [Alcanivorax profundi]|uniref:endonuclease/exonuclease/phosphatase family protein n=1 Tax=Alcanivorax profundi TaxID=2338368 RepID=UPI0013148D9C
GGVAAIHKAAIRFIGTSQLKFNSFEVLHIKHIPSQINGSKTFYLAVIYRPPGPYSSFLDEFGAFLSDLIIHSDSILVVGDFNIHLNKESDPLARAFQSLLTTLSFSQFVHEPTHISGNYLDLVLARGIDVSHLLVSSLSSAISDHSLVEFEISY